MLIDKIYKLFGWCRHNWGKWEHSHFNRYYVELFSENSALPTRRTMVQIRKCEKCGLVKLKESEV